MVSPYTLLLVDYLLALAVQVAASIQDLRTREISDWTWIIGSIICIPLSLYAVIMLNQLILYIISVVVGSVFALAVYWLRAMGGADSKSIAFISASIPRYP
ncbi:A24 family peptidase [Vulcanisaeta distributa]|uniref:A24 family peptidase n=1 Tax=Vulcanisaeta distributa TaxID=164451 RepID=UPI000AB37B94|nr:A24 family peptidase [Vulcanisaeta distributa]